MGLRRFDAATLTRFRETPAGGALALLAVHINADPSYLPLKDGDSRRWHARTTSGEFEILTTGPKWYDTRSTWRCMFLDLSFVDAVNHLTDEIGRHGSDHS